MSKTASESRQGKVRASKSQSKFVRVTPRQRGQGQEKSEPVRGSQSQAESSRSVVSETATVRINQRQSEKVDSQIQDV